jgi:hypothetical protein
VRYLACVHLTSTSWHAHLNGAGRLGYGAL